MQSVAITTAVLSSWRGVLDKTLCDKVCRRLATGRWFSPGTPVSTTNETDRHDITEILLIVALITINLNHFLRFYLPVDKLGFISIYSGVLCGYIYTVWSSSIELLTLICESSIIHDIQFVLLGILGVLYSFLLLAIVSVCEASNKKGVAINGGDVYHCGDEDALNNVHWW